MRIHNCYEEGYINLCLDSLIPQTLMNLNVNVCFIHISPLLSNWGKEKLFELISFVHFPALLHQARARASWNGKRRRRNISNYVVYWIRAFIVIARRNWFLRIFLPLFSHPSLLFSSFQRLRNVKWTLGVSVDQGRQRSGNFRLH